MFKINNIVALLFFCIYSNSVLSQECSFESLDNSSLKEHLFPNSTSRCNDECLDVCEYPSQYTIPVAFHVINGGENQSFPGLSVIELALETANSIMGDHFTLVRADTYYPCVEFINTPEEEYPLLIQNVQYGEVNEQEIFQLSRYNPDRILNIYYVRNINTPTNSPKGYSYSPAISSWSREVDGIVLRKSDLGAGETLAHELGHYLTLLHIWGLKEYEDENCHDESSSCTQGDLIPDTEPCRGRYPFPNSISSGCEVNPTLWEDVFEGTTSNPFCDSEMNYDCGNIMGYGTNKDEVSGGQFNRMIFGKNEFRPFLNAQFFMPSISDIEFYGFTLNWNVNVNSGGYQILYKKIGADKYTEILIEDEDITSWIVENLEAGSEYEVKIRHLCTDNYNIFIIETPCNPGVLCDLCNQEIDINISSQQVLQQTEISGNLILHNGAEVTINSKVEFRENSKIIVKPGAKLIVEGNGLLTKCPDVEYWQGIVIEGLNNSGLNSGIGGEVEIRNGGSVEYANIGVKKLNTIYTSNGNLESLVNTDVGKLSITKNGEIRNCKIGVQLNSTGGNIFNVAESSIINEARFSECEIGIQLKNNHGLIIENSTFDDFNGFEFGIELINSSADILENSFTAIGSCIEIKANYPNLQGTLIDQNAFNSSYFAVRMNSQNNVENVVISNNTIFTGQIAHWGLSNYRIKNNDILENFQVNNFGIEISATGQNIGNYIRQNSFLNNHIGINVDQINSAEILSNCFEFTEEADVGLGLASTVDLAQGNTVDEAGNCFDRRSGVQTYETDVQYATTYHKKDPLDDWGPNWNDTECKEPGQAGFMFDNEMLDVKNSELDVSLLCGTGVVTQGGNYSYFYNEMDCQERINDLVIDPSALQEFIDDLEQEIINIEINSSINELVKQELLSRLRECLDRAIKAGVKQIFLEIGNNSTSNGVIFLQQFSDIRYQIMAYGVMMNNSEHTNALNYLNSLSMQTDEELDFKQAQLIYHDYLNDINNYFLSISDEISLRQIGLERNSLAGFARSIYYTITGVQLDYDVPLYYDVHRNRNLYNDRDLEQFKVYPNPSSVNNEVIFDVLSMDEKEEAFKLEIYNSNGVLVFSKHVDIGRNSIDLNDDKGLFFILVKSPQEIIYSERIIRM